MKELKHAVHGAIKMLKTQTVLPPGRFMPHSEPNYISSSAATVTPEYVYQKAPQFPSLGYDSTLQHQSFMPVPPPTPFYNPYQPNHVSSQQTQSFSGTNSTTELNSTMDTIDLLNESIDVPPLPPPISFSPIQTDDARFQASLTESLDTFKSSEETEDYVGSSDYPPKVPLKQKNCRSKKSPSEKDYEKVYPITEIFNPEFLSKCRAKSCSRPNFATILVRKFFTKAVRISSNVSGKCGKTPLNKEMMAAIRVASFKMWPLALTENEKAAWSLCVKAIDEGGRRLYRPKGSSKENID